MAEALDAAKQAQQAQQAQQRAAIANRLKYPVQLEIPTRRCEWFMLCNNLATHDKQHPILGLVPCCDRCEEIGE